MPESDCQKITDKSTTIADVARFGYFFPKLLKDGRVVAIQPQLFTFGLMVDVTEQGYGYRYCYEHLHEALSALHDWDGIDDPPGPWIKKKGLGVDILGPGAIDD